MFPSVGRDLGIRHPSSMESCHFRTGNSENESVNRDLKLSPCSECKILFFGLFAGGSLYSETLANNPRNKILHSVKVSTSQFRIVRPCSPGAVTAWKTLAWIEGQC